MRILCTLALAFVILMSATAAQALNPQPEPPGRAVNQLNAQPPAAADAQAPGTKTTTLSPRNTHSNIKTRKATWAAGSDSGDGSNKVHGTAMRNPGQKATWAAGSDSGESHHNLGPGLGAIHMND